MLSVKNQKYRITSDCYFNELGWNLRCEFENLETGECKHVCPSPNIVRPSEADAERDAIAWGKKIASSDQLGF